MLKPEVVLIWNTLYVFKYPYNTQFSKQYSVTKIRFNQLLPTQWKSGSSGRNSWKNSRNLPKLRFARRCSRISFLPPSTGSAVASPGKLASAFARRRRHRDDCFWEVCWVSCSFPKEYQDCRCILVGKGSGSPRLIALDSYR